jgi:hypothetical protein
MNDIKEFASNMFLFFLPGTTCAFIIARFFGKKIVKHLFDKYLEHFKARNLYEFDLLLNRKLKWYAKEHDVLTDAWGKLIKAHSAIETSIRPGRETLNLNDMKHENLISFIEKNKFTESERKFLREETNKNSAYDRILSFRELNEAYRLLNEFDCYIKENRIFISMKVNNSIKTITDQLWSVVIDKKIHLDYKDISSLKYARKSFKNDVEELMNQIENKIREYLFPEDKK